MPIRHFSNETVQLEFGRGDIRVSSGILKDSGPDVVGAVCFFQEETISPIGTSLAPTKKPELIPQEETPVRMLFSKEESIDVVIKALQKAKRNMQNNTVESDMEGEDE